MNRREENLIYTLLALTVLPHTLHLPTLLNLYLALFLLYLIFRDRFRLKNSLALIIFSSIGLSFGLVEYISYINVTELSKAKIFIDIVSSMLIFMVSLLIINRFESPLIKFSPVLLLMMSLFYFENLIYLLYSITVLFVTVVGIIYSKSALKMEDAVKYSVSMFLASLPIVVLLFFTFPRISYEKSSFGFKGDDRLITGLGDSISFGSGEELFRSDRVVMEVMFKERVPPSNQLYFRGAVLYDYDNNGSWRAKSGVGSFTESPEILYPNIKSGDRNRNIIDYTATIYPTFDKRVAQLDYPYRFPKKSRIDMDYTIKFSKALFKAKKFHFQSTTRGGLRYIDEFIRKKSLQLPDGNLRTKKLAEEIRDSSKSDLEAIKALEKFFLSLKVEYTLKPPKLKSDDKIDEIVFESKKGYCVHLSSTFTYMLRAMKIPARVVTGYKGDSKNMIDKYLIIRAKDAHSWVEAYSPKSGWIRLDPTKYAVITADSALQKKTPFWQRVTLKVMYLKYKIEEWVLYYSRLKQIKLLNMVRENSFFLLYIFGAFGLLTIFSLYFIRVGFRYSRGDKVSKIYNKLLLKLERVGYFKKSFEGAESFAKRVGIDEVKKITEQYLILKYKSRGQDKTLFKEFKKRVERFKIDSKK